MTITAADIMTSPAIVAAPETTMAQVASMLASNRISAVPICAPDDTLLGIVSEGDILKPFSESFRRRREWWAGVVAEGESLPRDFIEYLRADARTAADVMVRHVIAAEEDMTLPELAELMTRHGIKRLPVLRQGKVVGIVSRSDLVKAVAKSQLKPE